MKYNIQDKLKEIDTIEANQKANDIISNAQSISIQKDSSVDSSPTSYNLESNAISHSQSLESHIYNTESTNKHKSSKRNFTFFLDEALIARLDSFLDEFGERKESKSTFIEEAVRALLETRESQIEQILKAKLARVQKR